MFFESIPGIIRIGWNGPICLMILLDLVSVTYKYSLPSAARYIFAAICTGPGIVRITIRYRNIRYDLSLVCVNDIPAMGMAFGEIDVFSIRSLCMAIRIAYDRYRPKDFSV